MCVSSHCIGLLCWEEAGYNEWGYNEWRLEVRVCMPSEVALSVGLVANAGGRPGLELVLGLVDGARASG